eukprot:CAMPEP_0194483900 /NCGR_PEP_ID=MMETSP0253-20130528/5393_1 /TAXON_ID=2966 /ORGANISM="Noctiluca scintillans" /LENGTH=180 /DNA_ID=CAMNT_0039323625 /DNA_START=98 /DNA_END=640 /DNA_ORIENTATION=-
MKRVLHPFASVRLGRPSCLRPVKSVNLCRAFAAAVDPIASTKQLYDNVVRKSVETFQANQAAVKSDLDQALSENKLVLFMEGPVDSPKSELSLNVVKMLTQVQAVPLLAIDVLAHPSILGYTVEKSGKPRTPHLYVDGNFAGDHDSLLSSYNSGGLQKYGTDSTRSTGKAFGGELPIALY